MSDERKSESETDWARIDAMTDDEIDTSDIPPLDDSFFERAQIRMPDGRRFSVPAEDAWAYAPEHRAPVERARNSPSYSGVTSEDLEEIASAPDPLATLERWTRHEP